MVLCGRRGRASAPGGRDDPAPRALFARGFLALLPRWTGAIPSGIACSVAARSAGLDWGEARLMSLVVFSAARQVGAVALLDAGAPAALLM